MKVLKLRRAIQWTMTAVVLLIGVQFSLWVMPHLAGRWPSVSRPPGVEAFLPIDAMLGLRHLLLTGTVDAVAPGSGLVPVGDVAALTEEIVAQVDAGIGRSSSRRQETTWVVENFERTRLWSGLVDRYHAWTPAS